MTSRRTTTRCCSCRFGAASDPSAATGASHRAARPILVGVALALGAVAGCSQSLEPVFGVQDRELAWPPAPSPSRIRYVGALTCSADLKAPRSFLDTLGSMIVGERTPEQMYGPRAVLCTNEGRKVWVADPGGRRVHIFNLEDRSYRAITRAGNSLLLSPVDVCAGPDGSVLVCDSEEVAIHRLSGLYGTAIESLRLPEDVGRPVSVHYDPVRRELFVVDIVGHDIKVLSPRGELLRIIGRRGTGPGEFNFPCDLTEQDGILWVVDAGNNRVQGLGPNGEPMQSFGRAGDAPGDFALPKGVAFDSDGHAYVVDARFENIQVFERDGRLLLFLGHEGNGPGEFWLPSGIFIDSLDRIWVCDSYNGRVQVFEYLREEPAASEVTEAGGSAEPGGKVTP